MSIATDTDRKRIDKLTVNINFSTLIMILELNTWIVFICYSSDLRNCQQKTGKYEQVHVSIPRIHNYTQYNVQLLFPKERCLFTSVVLACFLSYGLSTDP